MAEETTTDAPAQPEPGSDEYNTQMAESYRTQANPDADNQAPAAPSSEVPAMPEGGVDKFYNAETGEYNWQAHAREAEYRLKQTKDKPDEPDVSDTDAAETDPNRAESGQGEGPDLSREALAKEFQENGKLSDDTRKALTDKGVPEDTISWMESTAKASAEAETKAALDEAGGEDAWQQMSQWAQENLDPAIVQDINAQLDSPNWRTGMAHLKAAYKAANGTGPKPMVDGGRGGSSPAGFQSRNEMMEAMADPKYNVDPVYTRDVMQKMKHRNFQD